MAERVISEASKNIGRSEFDGGAFSISCLSHSPGGFDVRTRSTLRRTEASKDPLKISADAKSRLKEGMRGEMRFNKVADLVSAKDAFKQELLMSVAAREIALPQYSPEDPRKNDDPNLYLARFMQASQTEGFLSTLPEPLLGAYKTFEEERVKYRQKGKKIGFRNIRVDGNTISTDVQMVSYPVLNQFGLPENNLALQDLSSFGATAMVLRTADNRLLIQHRAVQKRRLSADGKLSSGNAVFNDVPGVSAAGILDASLLGEERVAGTPDPVDTGTLKANILKEASEELGLGSDDLTDVRIVGFAHDNIKLHDEALYLAQSKLSAEQIKLKSQETNRNRRLGPADFEEKFIDIACTTENIEKLLTEVKCPLPPTHAATLVAAGYSLILEEKGKFEADVWKVRVERSIKSNYTDIDKRVKQFYDKHPEVMTREQVPERFWGKTPPPRKIAGYDPAYTPDEQGLPSFEDAMIEAGLLPETRKPVETAWLFDVDGVLSDPVTKKVPEELLDKLVAKLQAGEPVGLNTGRSSRWIEERVIVPLREKVQDIKVLENLCIIAEFGATWDTFGQEGNLRHGKVDTLDLPEAITERVKALAGNYRESMMYDDSKETHVTLEMKDGYDLGQFQAQQRDLAEAFQKIVEDTGNESKYMVHADTIATNIKSPYVTKALGVLRFREFLRERNIKAKQFKAFGDSISDLEMADELLRKGENVTFIFVGEKSKLAEARRNGLVKDEEKITAVGGYTHGTLDYLAA